MGRTKKLCEKCEREISNSNFNRHINSCKGKIEKEVINIKHLLQENGKYKCPYCDKEYSKNGIGTHIWRNHGEGKNHDPVKDFKNGTKTVWNKGLTKETDERVKKNSESVSQSLKGENSYWYGKVLPKEVKQKISNTMKINHAEGRAWNIGMSRWNNEPSYPEKFFMEVIENEFTDKNYKREFSISIYSIDFAWVSKKLAIEIDGQQHEKEEYKQRDIRKDKCLLDNGWKVLRIKWKDMYENPKFQIEIAKKFIEGS